MSLQKLLDGQRKKRSDRKVGRRMNRHRADLKAGRVPQFSTLESLSRAGLQIAGDDFMDDMDKLLIARNLHLCVSWSGWTGRVFAQDADGEQTDLHVYGLRSRSIDMSGMLTTEIGQRLTKLLDLHNCELSGYFDGDKFGLLLSHRDIPESYSFRLAMTGYGKSSRYMKRSEKDE